MVTGRGGCQLVIQHAGGEMLKMGESEMSGEGKQKQGVVKLEKKKNEAQAAAVYKAMTSRFAPVMLLLIRHTTLIYSFRQQS